ncbi:hypothetical protein [uncultured Ruminococcus sp.]|nr:hypothetical protein [uncultured Ruminococcus sp.]
MLHSRQPVYDELVHLFLGQSHICELFPEEALGVTSRNAEAL